MRDPVGEMGLPSCGSHRQRRRSPVTQAGVLPTFSLAAVTLPVMSRATYAALYCTPMNSSKCATLNVRDWCHNVLFKPLRGHATAARTERQKFGSFFKFLLFVDFNVCYIHVCTLFCENRCCIYYNICNNVLYEVRYVCCLALRVITQIPIEISFVAIAPIARHLGLLFTVTLPNSALSCKVKHVNSSIMLQEKTYIVDSC